MMLKEERDYYGKYRWTLMPFLSFEQILTQLNNLLDEDIFLLPGWCRQEWNINLYMLSSAGLDLIDDYLVRGVWNLIKLADYFSFASRPVQMIREVTTMACRLRGRFQDKGMRKWQKLWSEWLISICEPLASGRLPDPKDKLEFRNELIPLIHYSFPNRLMKMRARIPAAYRSQDLSHYDFLSLSSKYIRKYSDQENRHVVIGVRTAGSYIAPLICSHLRSRGYKQTSFITIRPKSFVHPWDEEHLRKCIAAKTRFILVDEPPSTGKTMAQCIEILRERGVKSEMITIMVPVHPANKDWLDESTRHSLENSDIISLDPGDWYKAKFLNAEDFGRCIKPYFVNLGYDDIQVTEADNSKGTNSRLSGNPDKAYHVRLKKVFQVTPKKNGVSQGEVFVMGKSVGWGWLGYHAALSAFALTGYIPRVFGVRDGIMYSEWIENSQKIDKPSAKEDNVVERISDYISSRTNQLKLEDDPASFLSAYREGGLQTIAIILSRVFGPKASKLKRGWVRDQLEKMACPIPALIDSKMMKDEWIHRGRELIKTDFEHHGFSKTATHNISDPAYDVASAIFEFELTNEREDKLINSYSEKTGDKTIKERLIFYKLLVGTEAMEESLRKLNLIRDPSLYEAMNRKYAGAWKFLVSEMMHQTANFCKGKPVRHWGKPMFVMDIDDVLDKNIFGFPTTTANGVRSLSLLRGHGVCSIINTARSLEEVKDYCSYYGFPGGIAEYGSVIWDDSEKREEILVSGEAMDELTLLRKALSRIPGIFLNPFYQHSIRAFLYDKQRTTPVPDAAIGEMFGALGIKHLTAKKSYIDTAIYDKCVDKGKALIKLKEIKGISDCKLAAVGDTESDLPMLIAADQGFLVNNSSIELKRKSRKFGISIMKSSFESGLLEAVNDFLHPGKARNCTNCNEILGKFGEKSDALWRFLNIADMSPIQHWIRVIDRRIFEMFQE